MGQVRVLAADFHRWYINCRRTDDMRELVSVVVHVYPPSWGALLNNSLERLGKGARLTCSCPLSIESLNWWSHCWGAQLSPHADGNWVMVVGVRHSVELVKHLGLSNCSCPPCRDRDVINAAAPNVGVAFESVPLAVMKSAES